MGREKDSVKSKDRPFPRRRRSSSPDDDNKRRESSEKSSSKRQKYSPPSSPTPRRHHRRRRSRSNSTSTKARRRRDNEAELRESARKRVEDEEDNRRRRDSTKPNSYSKKMDVVKREWDLSPPPKKHEEFAKPKSENNWGRQQLEKEANNKREVEMEKPSFEPSGKLAEDTNTFKGVLIKYNEPAEAKLPKIRWRLYPFKGEEHLPVIYIHRQSAYLIGRDRKIADFPIDHPSCSKQHAVIQYRSLQYNRLDGSMGRRTRPYIIDLGSANGTYLNKERIEPQRYYELMEKDVLKFGFSSREFVVLNEKSLEQEEEDDLSENEEDEDAKLGVDISGAEEKMENAEEDDLF